MILLGTLLAWLDRGELWDFLRLYWCGSCELRLRLFVALGYCVIGNLVSYVLPTTSDRLCGIVRPLGWIGLIGRLVGPDLANVRLVWALF